MFIANRIAIGQPIFGGGAFSNLESILYDGISKHSNIDAVQTALASTTQGTISFWVNPIDSTPTGVEVLYSFGDTNGTDEIICYLNTNGTLIAFCYKGGALQWNLTTDNAVLSSGVWTNVCVVQDGVSPKLYVNGFLPNQTINVTTDKTCWFNNYTLIDNGRFGCRSTGSSNTLFFNGYIDEAIFTNDAKTQSEIIDIWNNGAPKDESSISNGVSYFRIDGDVVPTMNDSIGSNDGTYVNCVQGDTKANVPTATDVSILYDGISKHSNIDAVQTALASTTVGTFSFWVKPVDATPTATERLLCFGDTSAKTSIRISLLSTGQIDYQVRLLGTNEWTLRTDAAVLTSGVWSHIAITNDNGGSPNIYINGVLVAQTDTVSNNNYWFNNLGDLDNGRIGVLNHNSSGNTGFANANIDEVLFINRELTQPQVADIYNGGTPKDENGIANGIAYFRVDGDVVPNMFDTIGTNNGAHVNCVQTDIKEDTP